MEKKSRERPFEEDMIMETTKFLPLFEELCDTWMKAQTDGPS